MKLPKFKDKKVNFGNTLKHDKVGKLKTKKGEFSVFKEK
jgi:hypothetical protein